MKSYVNLRHLSAVAGGDVERTGALPQDFPAGQQVWLMSDFGLGLFTCVQNRTASTFAQGALLSSVGGNDAKTAISNITSGSKVHAITSGLTADAHVGAICYVVDSAQGTGIAPEGESAVVKRNTATRIDLKEPGYTVALGANDDLTLRGTYNAELSASGDTNTTVLGVVIPENGIAAAYFGWAQTFGINARTLVQASTAITVDKPLIAHTGRATLWGTTAAHNTIIGQAIGGASSDIVSDLILSQLACGFMNLGAWADTDSNAA